MIPRTVSFSLLLILIIKHANPNWLFEEKHRKTIYIRIPFSESSKHYALKFIGKLEDFAKEKYSSVTTWRKRNILFCA